MKPPFSSLSSRHQMPITFNGSEYLSYFSKDGIPPETVSPFPASSFSSMFPSLTSERITIQFKTRVSNGLLYYSSSSSSSSGSSFGESGATSGSNENYVKIAIKNGRVSFVMKMGSNLVEKEIGKGNKIRFDDNHWHLIHVTRKFKEVRILNSIFFLISSLFLSLLSLYSFLFSVLTISSSFCHDSEEMEMEEEGGGKKMR